MTDPTYTALRAYERSVAGLIADPDVTGDLLLIGLWLARVEHLGQPERTDGEGWRTSDIARDVFPLHTRTAMFMLGEWDQGQETGPDVWKVNGVLQGDIRRYDWKADQPGSGKGRTPCTGPTPRRDVCGRPSLTGALLTDPRTGRRRMLGACRRHGDWWRAQVAANRAACAAVEVPRPAANAGGRLARHIRLDWPALWLVLDPTWVAPPEVDSWVRPDLRLVVTVAPEPAHRDGLPPAPRPRFAVIDGARV